MMDKNFLGKHRAWEDWLAIALGVAIWATTKAWIAHTPLIYWNTTIVGILVLMLATVIHDNHARSREFAEAVCGLWLMASPFVFGYATAGTLRFWHFGLGAAVAVLAIVELVQDWNEPKE